MQIALLGSKEAEISMIDIDAYRKYPSFQPGQKEAVGQILELYQEGHKVVELDGPTASGKSYILYLVGKILDKEKMTRRGGGEENDASGRIVYTTPLVALANQLGSEKAFSDMPVLKGKRNYPCPKLIAVLGAGFTAEDCPYQTIEEALANRCFTCPHREAKATFKRHRFGAMTFASWQAYFDIRYETAVLLVDESAGLEKVLIDRAKLKLPDEVDVHDFVPSLTAFLHDIGCAIAYLNKRIATLDNSEDLRYKVDLIRQRTKAERVEDKCIKILDHVEKKHPFIVDKERQFRLLDGTPIFNDLIKPLDMIVLASGTPTTEILTKEFKKVVVQHPIPVENRRCYYWPQGMMNYKERAITAPKIAAAIENLHNRYHKKVMVHCGGYTIAGMIYDKLSPYAKKIAILQRPPPFRELDKEEFQKRNGEAIFLSVAFEEGLDLKGDDYPVNVIAKVPFEVFNDEYVARRNEMDNKMRYNMNTAVAVMQAAGRNVRRPDDLGPNGKPKFTVILDSSWQGFYNRSRKLFRPWFVAALGNFEAKP